MSNIVELGKRGIRNEAELRRFIKSHANAEPGQMVQAINISMMLSITSDNAAHHHRLDAGRMLLELRQTIESDGENWWQWQQGKFQRSRKDMEKLMRMAADDNPEEAFEEERTERNERRARAKSDGAARRSKPEEDITIVEYILETIRLLTLEQMEELKAKLKERYSW